MLIMIRSKEERIQVFGGRRRRVLYMIVCLGTYIKLSSNERQSAYLYEESSFRIGARLRALS